MLAAARALIAQVQVHRTRTSPVDTLGGNLGEMAFAQWFTGAWQNHEVGRNKGRADFRGVVEVKASVFPFRENLNLVIREDYGARSTPLYVQLIIDVADRAEKRIEAGTPVVLCGFTTHERATARPPTPMRAGRGQTPYRAFLTPIAELSPMDGFAAAYERVASHPADQA